MQVPTEAELGSFDRAFKHADVIYPKSIEVKFTVLIMLLERAFDVLRCAHSMTRQEITCTIGG